MTPPTTSAPQHAAGAGPVEEYWKRAADGTFSLPTCTACGYRFLPPRLYCPSCGSESLGWTESDGAGQIYSYSVVARTTDTRFSAAVPYVIALAELDDLSVGSRLYARVVDVDPAKVSVGRRVRVVVRDLDDTRPVPVLQIQEADG